MNLNPWSDSENPVQATKCIRNEGLNHLTPPRVTTAVILSLTMFGFLACSSPKTSTSPSPTASPTPSATSTSTAGRGLTGVVTVAAGTGGDDLRSNKIPGPGSELHLGDKANYALAPNGDVFLTIGTTDVLKISGGQVSVVAQLDAVNVATQGIAVGSDGSLYVASPSTIRKFTPDGKSTDLLKAGADTPSSLGPIALDAAGNLYVGDGDPKITLITARDGSKRVVAGIKDQAASNSAPGDGGPANAAALGALSQIAVDAKGNLLIADSHAHRVRQVAPDGTITTIAGGGATKLAANTGSFAPDGTKATDLELLEVNGVALDAKGRIYVADAGDEAIFRFTPGAGIELVAGNQAGSSLDPGQPANQFRVRNPNRLAFDTQGNLFFLDARLIYRIAGAGS